MSALDKVTDALHAAGCDQRYGGNWNCPGPGHSNGDRKPSLHVTSDSRSVALKCHTGCDTRDIVAALGLEMTDLFDEPLVRREVARYPYVDEDGEVLFAKIRMEPKDFRIAHPNGGGEWASGLGNIRRVIYNLPGVLAAVLSGETIYVAEGEKDADRLINLGFTATCNFEGAGTGKPKWRQEYSEWFSGAARVIIIADRDEAGIAHAKAVRSELKGFAKDVRIMQSRTEGKGDDISDHLDAGFSMSQLVPLSLAGGRPYRTVSLAETSRRGVPAPVLLCDGLLYEGGLHSIAGAPDCGKTTLALYWAVHLLREGKPVVFLDEEGGEDIVVEKMHALGATHEELELVTYVPFPGRSWDDDDIGELMSFAKEIDPAMLLVDSSAAFLARAGLDENSAPAVTSWWSRVLTPVARDIGAAVLVIDHDTKGTEVSRYARGSGAKLAALDVQIKVTMVTPFTRQQEGNLKVVITKDRRGWLHRNWNVDVRTGEGVIDPEFTREDPEQAAKSANSSWPPSRRSLYEQMKDYPQSSQSLVDAIVDSGGIPLKRETRSRELNKLADDGFILRHEQEHGRETLWSLPPKENHVSEHVTARDQSRDDEYPWEAPF